MDFLNRTFGQWYDAIRAMSPAARWVSAALLGVVVVSLALLAGYRSSGAEVYLMNGQVFRPNDLPGMEAAFAKAGLAGYQFEGTRIKVPRAQQNAYIAALAENNALPENYHEIMDRAFKNLRPWSSKTEQEQLLKDAKRRQLEAIIRDMKGVAVAYVLFDAEKAPGLRQETLRTASVNVTMAPGERLSAAQLAAIRSLVSKAFVNLPPDSVAVTDLANVGAEPAGPEAIGPDDPYIARKQYYERQWRENILRALSYVPGVNVVANVELDRQQRRRTETIKPEGPASPSVPAPKPATPEPQRVNTAVALVNMAMSLDELAARQTKANEPSLLASGGNTRETIEGVGLTPTRVTVAVSVPNGYFLKVWHERHLVGPTHSVSPDAASLDQIRLEELKKIKEHVAKLLPAAEGISDPTELVQVTSFQDFAPAPIAPPTSQDRLLEWLAQHWQTVGLFGIALVGMVLLRSTVRPASRPAVVDEAVGKKLDLTEETAESAAMPIRRVDAPVGSFRDRLSQLVQEDPDAAAGVLRSWIGTASGK